MTQRNSTPAARKKPLLAHLYRRNEATASFSIADGPAWRSRAVAPTRPLRLSVAG